MNPLWPLWPYIRRYRGWILFGGVSVLICSALRAMIPQYLGNAIDWIREGRVTRRELLYYAMFICSLAGLAGCFMFLMRRAIIDASREIEFDFRNDFFRQLLRLDPSFYDGQQTGELMARATNDIEAVRLVVGPGLLYLFNALFMVTLVLRQMLSINWALTFWALLPLLLLPPLVIVMGRRLYQRSREVQAQYGRLTTVAQENLAGVRVVRAYVQEEPELRKFERENEKLIDRSLAHARLQAAFIPLLKFIAGLGLLMVLLLGGKGVIEGTLPLGELIAMTILFEMLVWPLIALGFVINVWQRGAAAMERINQIFFARPLVGEVGPVSWPGERLMRENTTPAPTVKDALEKPGALESPPGGFVLRGEVEFRRLTFVYPGGRDPVLRDVTLTIPAGGSLGIVGGVGSGKSTLAALLVRLYPVERGMIFIDGRDINDWPLDLLRGGISLVFQESFIFSDSISENVAFGRHETPNGEAEILDVATWARLHADIERFPERYQTMLGERGINLSGGQKQRLALARALIRNPRMLIVDDALSAVDTHTEADILESLRRVARDRTTLVISHRLSTLSWADRIIVLDEGRVVESGAHRELMAVNGIYADLYARQQLEQQVEAIE
jgi:ATP-binding cassette subfamily B protein